MKKIALSDIGHASKEHYENVWDYGQEIINTNPGSIVNICSDLGTPPRFQRFYICFYAIKKNKIGGLGVSLL